MDDNFKKIAPFLTILLIIVFLSTSYVLYENKVRNIEQTTHNKLNNSIYHFKEYFSISESFLYAMKFTIEDKLKNHCHCTHPKHNDINRYNDLFYIKNLNSILIGLEDENFSEIFKNEINSALYLNPIFQAAQKVLPDMKKIYYKSKNKFIFVSPKIDLKNKKDLLSQYTCPSWQDSLKQINIYEQFIITKAYTDFYSKLRLITLSLPIYKNKDFSGIVSIDIKLDTLVSYIKMIPLEDNLYIVDSKNNLISSKYNKKPNKKIFSNQSSFIKKEIIKNQIYLIYPLDKEKIRKKAFRNSLGEISIAFLIMLISIILIYLRNLLTKVQSLADTDSLTNLLNRRAMKEAMDNQIKISRRYRQDLSFLLIDID